MKKVPALIRFDSDLLKCIDAQAKNEHRSRTNLIVKVMDDYIKQYYEILDENTKEE